MKATNLANSATFDISTLTLCRITEFDARFVAAAASSFGAHERFTNPIPDPPTPSSSLFYREMKCPGGIANLLPKTRLRTEKSNAAEFVRLEGFIRGRQYKVGRGKRQRLVECAKMTKKCTEM